MIIFLYGLDSFRSKEKLQEIIDHYKKAKKSGLNLLYLDAEKSDFSDFYDNLKISPMFAETKLVVLKNVFSNPSAQAGKNFQEDFAKEIKTLQELKDVIVVYESDEVDQRLTLFKLLLKSGKCQEFKPLDGKNLKMWATTQFSVMEAKINNDALDLLLSYAGNDLWKISNEIKKLADFKYGGVIQKADVELLIKPNIAVDIFKTIDALAEKNKKKAMELLYKHLDSGEKPLYLLSMIAYQFKNLLIVKELSEKGMMYASMVKKSGLHPFVVKKTYFLCRQFTFLELKNIYRRIFSLDSDIKTGNIEPETALDLLVSSI